MPSGDNTTASLADSLPSVVHSARIVREQVGQGFTGTVEKKSLPMGTGSSWREVDLAKITAQAVPQDSKLDNPQQLVDTLISVEPTMVGIHMIFTPELVHYVSENVAGEWGALMQNAIQRQKDRAGINIYDGATVTGGGTGTTLTAGIVSAMVAQIQSDVDESALETEEVYTTLHGFQLHDLRTEITGGIGSYPVPSGLSADAYNQGKKVIERVGGATIKWNNNVRIDSTPDGHGGVHAKSGIVLVEVSGKKRAFTETLSNRAGAQAMWLYDWYGYLERSAGNLVKRILSDATAPTTG